jgi:hypothetical protein
MAIPALIRKIFQTHLCNVARETGRRKGDNLFSPARWRATVRKYDCTGILEAGYCREKGFDF